jgi:hypothetical protein
VLMMTAPMTVYRSSSRRAIRWIARRIDILTRRSDPLIPPHSPETCEIQELLVASASRSSDSSRFPFQLTHDTVPYPLFSLPDCAVSLLPMNATRGLLNLGFRSTTMVTALAPLSHHGDRTDETALFCFVHPNDFALGWLQRDDEIIAVSLDGVFDQCDTVS